MTSLNISTTRTENKETNQTKFENFVTLLHRGGRYAYLWNRFEGAPGGGDSYWWLVDADPIPTIGAAPRKMHEYFSVHPLAEVPKTNKQGASTEPHRVRGRIEHVAAINCLFADMDTKDFSSVAAMRDHIKAIQPKPSAVVSTGNGVHLYWFLDQPFPIYNHPENLKRAMSLQYRWQKYTKSDPGAKDLARVLRVPGSDNWKGGKQKACRFRHLDLNKPYTLAELESHLPLETTGTLPKTEIKAIADPKTEARKAKLALSLLKPWRADDRESWIEIGMSLSGLGEIGLKLWDEWSQQSTKYDSDDTASKWGSFSEPQETDARAPVTLGTLYYRAREDAADFSKEDESSLLDLLDGATDPQSTIVQRIETKKHLAERLVWYPASIQTEMRFKAKQKKWMKAEFDQALDAVGSPDDESALAEDADSFKVSGSWMRAYPDTLRVNNEWFRYGDGVWVPREDELIFRELSETAADQGIVLTPSTIYGAIQFSRAYVPHRNPNEWNPDANILVVRNGVLDISTDPPTFHKWSNRHYNRVMMPVEYDPDATAPTYQKALLENLAGKKSVVRFFIEFAGLSLAEIGKYEVSPWLSGPPGGGKSTLLAGLNAVLGDYAGSVDLDRLDTYAHGRVAILDKKLIYAYEVDTKFLTSPGSLSAIISHEPIQVNPKGQPEYSYTPRCAVMFAVNELPGTTNPDSGIFRRIKVVPVAGRDSLLHDVTIRQTIEQDEIERSGMLNLFLAGLAMVRKRNGILLPISVEDATREWRIDNDKVRMHIIERCETGPKFVVGSSKLYDDFKGWCRNSGIKAYGHNTWGRRMTALRYQKSKSHGVILYEGLKLRPQPTKVNVPIDLKRIHQN